jgi:hypothetical protein
MKTRKRFIDPILTAVLIVFALTLIGWFILA